MDSARRCKECKRVVRGHVGDACPYCGSDRLVSVVIQSVTTVRHHASVLTAAITFCLGLTLIRLIAAFAGSKLSTSFAMTADLIAQLHLLATSCTVLYLIVRHYEGDFRALFVVSLGLFSVTEGISILSSRFGMLPLRDLGGLFNITLFMYSSLALTAAIADGPVHDRYQRPLTVACLGFVLLSCTRVFFQMRGGTDERLNFASTIILLVMTAVIAVLLLRTDTGSGTRAADSSTMPAVGRDPAPNAPETTRGGVGA